MKYIVLAALLFLQLAQAKLIQCETPEKRYSVTADIDFENLKVNQMSYSKDGKVYAEFEDLRLGQYICCRRVKGYEVIFKFGSYYMDLEHHPSGIVTGTYIPNGRFLDHEESLTCTEID